MPPTGCAGLGEPADRVHVTGAPGLDRLAGLARPDGRRSSPPPWAARSPGPLALFTYHPPDGRRGRRRAGLGRGGAARHLARCGTVVATHPGMDAGRDEVLAALAERRRATRGSWSARTSARTTRSCSPAPTSSSATRSSGVIEAASVGVPVVDVGDRQRGRLRGDNVVHADEGEAGGRGGPATSPCPRSHRAPVRRRSSTPTATAAPPARVVEVRPRRTGRRFARPSRSSTPRSATMTAAGPRAGLRPATTASLREVDQVIDRHATSMCLLVDDGGRPRRRAHRRRPAPRPAGRRRARRPRPRPRARRARTSWRRLAARASCSTSCRPCGISAVPEVDADVAARPAAHPLRRRRHRRLPNVAVVMAGGRGTRLGRPDQGHAEAADDGRRAARSSTGSSSASSATASARSTSASTTSPTRSRSTSATARASAARVHYLREEPDHPLGTAGSLRLLREDRPDLARPRRRHERRPDGRLRRPRPARATTRRTAAAVTMGVRSLPARGAVRGRRARRRRPRHRDRREADPHAARSTPAVYAVEPEVVALLPDGRPEHDAGLVEQCLARDHTVAAWAISEDWIDVGTPADLARAKGQL